ncbi:Magnesium transporter mgtE [Anoxybacillus ayderensis]|uniref:Magnesium transporter MgtE n=1 Tax=Anoxybacillus ayderensis TaxID=265546 RepID=A0A0D0G8G8_9BACL|nr:magnesium transporter [Anoxybacillus ayderensis]KIP21690.1 Magnesium transporter mgtE [Anoxybacillus ayderensis]
MLVQALRDEKMEEFRKQFLKLHPYDRAKFYVEQSPEVRKRMYEYLSPAEMAEIFDHLDIEEDEYKIYLSEMDPMFVAQMLAHMYADNAADVLNELDKNEVANYLTIMDDEAAKDIQGLLHYKEYTAGSIMTTEYIAIHANQTVRSAMQILKREAANAETIYYLYVVNEQRQLVGVLSLRELLTSDDDAMIHDVMNDQVVSVLVDEDQEDVARKMQNYDFLALPVVDANNHLLGIITVDDIVDVISEEATDDYSKLAGVPDVDIQYTPFEAAKKRLPWLIILLFLGMMTANLISRFEDTLQKVAILAVFIPLIAGMSGNTGTQSLAVAVRRLAMGDLEKEGKWRMLAREALTGLLIGLSCGVVITIVVYVWKQQFFLGVLVGLALFATLTVATVAGALIPLAMHKLRIDPAVASGPFITTINDLISILIYFGLATMFMDYLL